MEETQRVDIKVDLETLAWAASEATKLGISRRKYLACKLKEMRLSEQSKKDGYSTPKLFGKVPVARIIPETKPE